MLVTFIKGMQQQITPVHWILWIPILTFFSACKPELDPQNPYEILGANCYLKSITHDGKLARTHKFTDDNLESETTYYLSNGDIDRSVVYEYDAAGEIVSIKEYKGSASASAYIEIIPEYDPYRKVVSMRSFVVNRSVTTPLQTLQYTYNDKNQLIQVSNTQGSYQKFEYDASGNVNKLYTKKALPGAKEYLTWEVLRYDDKNTPASLNKSIRMYFLYDLPLASIPRHNDLSVNYYNDDGSLYYNLTSSFSYNSSNYPVEINYVQKYASDKGTVESQQMIEYYCK